LEAEIEKWIKSNPIIVNGQGRAPTAAEIAERKKAELAKIKYNTGSYTAAYNRYMTDVAKPEKRITRFPPTLISFVIPKEIAESKIVDPQRSQSTNTKFGDRNRGTNQTADPDFKNVEVFNIQAGQSVIEVIDLVIGKSDYIKNQINAQNQLRDEEQANQEYTNGAERTDNKASPKNIKWYKIIPTVELKDFDAIRNTYSKNVTYSIVPYTAANAYHPNFVKTTGKDVEQQVVREYNYLYTGKNQDITRVDIDFDTAYYTQISTYREQVARGGTSRTSEPQDNPENLQTPDTNATSSYYVPVTTEVNGYNIKATGMNTATNPEEKIVADLKNSIYTKSRGDNLNIKIQIIGDPDFIKQDDIYYNPSSEEYAQMMASRSQRPVVLDGPTAGQILFDSEQIYVRLNFKNAVDIDDSIGIQNKQETLQNGRKTDGSFSGIYKVLTVQSEFSRGQFTQTLDIVRMPDDLPKSSQAKNKSVNNASSDYSGRQQISTQAGVQS
jgi:hypothetical protein